MSNDHLLEDKNITLLNNTVICGQTAKAGSKLIFNSSQGEFRGFKMRIPPPEFEALLFFSAFESAANAQVLKKSVKVSKSDADSLSEVGICEDNRSTFFSVCQNAMAANHVFHKCD